MADRPAARLAELLVAARRHDVSYSLLRSIAWCESGLNPRAQAPTSTAGA